MSYKLTAVAKSNVATEAVTVEHSGRLDVALSVRDAANVCVAYRRNGENVKAIDDTAVTGEAIYDGDALVNTPVAPGSVVIASTGAPTLVDRDMNGVLRINRTVGTKLEYGAIGATSVPASRTLTAAGKNFTTAGVVAGDKVVIASGQDAGVYTAVTVGTTTIVVDRNFPVGSLTALDFAVFAEDPACGYINYFTGKVNLAYPSSPAAGVPSSKGTVLGTVAFPINLTPGVVLAVDIDAGGAANATFDAAASTLPGAAGSFAAMSSETMDVRFKDGGTWGEWQTITFGTEATQQLAVDLMNAQMMGGYAVINAANVDLVSDGKGTGAQVQTANVAAGITTKLGIPDATTSTAGTGDVVDINAVTFAEAKAVIEADVSDSLATLDGGKLRISSDSAEVGADSKVQISAGAAATAFGLDTSLHTGADEGATMAVTAAYINTTSITGVARTTKTIVNPVGKRVDLYLTGSAATKVDMEVSV